MSQEYNKIVIALQILVFVGIFCRVESIKCHHCHSGFNETCASNPRTTQQKECSVKLMTQTSRAITLAIAGYSKVLFRKIPQSYDISPLKNIEEQSDPMVCVDVIKKMQDGKNVVIRGCHYEAFETICEKLVNDLSLNHCNVCDKDGCNSSSIMKFDFLFLIFILGIFILLSG